MFALLFSVNYCKILYLLCHIHVSNFQKCDREEKLLSCVTHVSFIFYHRFYPCPAELMFMLSPKNFERESVNIFLSISLNICFGYSKEPSQ